MEKITDVKAKYQLDQNDFNKLLEKNEIPAYKLMDVLNAIGVKVAWKK